jgi:hypothetical protein
MGELMITHLGQCRGQDLRDNLRGVLQEKCNEQCTGNQHHVYGTPTEGRHAPLTVDAPSLQEYLLCEIIRERDVTATTPHQVSYPLLPTPHEFGKRVTIPIARETHE